MKVLIIADPFEKLKPATDTTLALLRGLLQKKRSVFWALADDLRLEDAHLRIRASRCLSCDPKQLPEVDASVDMALAEFKLVWIRKDPPFDKSYMALCWLLALEEGKIRMINSPSVLLRYHEKLLPFEAFAQGYLKASDLVPTHIGSSESARAYLQQRGLAQAIRKPFLGFAGGGIHKFSLPAGDALPDPDELELTQPFLPEISTVGDRRVFYIHGKIMGDFVRLPKPGSFVSNLAQGGSGRLSEFSKSERRVAEKVGKFLRHSGIVFAGADMIGAQVSEINITSPTGVVTYQALSGNDLVPKLLKA